MPVQFVASACPGALHEAQGIIVRSKVAASRDPCDLCMPRNSSDQARDRLHSMLQSMHFLCRDVRVPIESGISFFADAGRLAARQVVRKVPAFREHVSQTKESGAS